MGAPLPTSQQSSYLPPANEKNRSHYSLGKLPLILTANQPHGDGGDGQWDWPLLEKQKPYQMDSGHMNMT